MTELAARLGSPADPILSGTRLSETTSRSICPWIGTNKALPLIRAIPVIFRTCLICAVACLRGGALRKPRVPWAKAEERRACFSWVKFVDRTCGTGTLKP